MHSLVFTLFDIHYDSRVSSEMSDYRMKSSRVGLQAIALIIRVMEIRK